MVGLLAICRASTVPLRVRVCVCVSLCLSVCLPVDLLICNPSICACIYLSTYLFAICRSVCPSMHLYIQPPDCLFVYLPTYLPIYLSIRLSSCVFICLSIYLYFYLSPSSTSINAIHQSHLSIHCLFIYLSFYRCIYLSMLSMSLPIYLATCTFQPSYAI